MPDGAFFMSLPYIGLREEKAKVKSESERDVFLHSVVLLLFHFSSLQGQTLYLLDVTYATASTLAKCVYFYFVAS